MVKWILLLSAFITTSAQAIDQPKAKLFMGRQDRSSWIDKTKWGWANNSEGVRLLKAAVYVNLPSDLAAQGQLVAESDSLQITNKGGSYILSAGAFKSRLVYRTRSGQETPLELNIAPQGQVFTDKCKDANIELKTKTPPPFFVGAACTMQGTKVKFNLTFPEEVSTGESTLFESKGKGESWRQYDLGDINAATAEIGRVTLLYNNKPYVFSIASLKSKASDQVKTEDAKKLFSASLGYASVSLSGAGTGSGGAAFFSGSAKPDPFFFGRIGVGGDVNVATPLSAGAGYAYLLIAPYAFGRLLTGPKLVWDLRGYLSFLSLSQSTTGIGVQATQPALGTVIAYNTEKWSYQLGYMSQSMIPKQTIDSSAQYTFKVTKKTTSKLDYGGGVIMESLQATSQAGYVYQYSLVGGFVTLGF